MSKTPWSTQNLLGTTYAIRDSRNVCIAVVGEVDKITDTENEANARLIAAAPELLEALKDVMSWVKNWDPEFTQDAEWEVSEKLARAAIQKAEG